MQPFSEKITLLMNSKGLTQAQLGQKLSVGQTTVGQWVRGVSRPNPRTMQKISEYFQISVDVLQDNTQILSLTNDENAISANLQIQNITHSLEKIINLKNDLNSTINDIVSLLEKQIKNIKNF